MSKKQKPILASHSGNLYIQAKVIMHPMIAVVDQLEIVTFKGDSQLYIGIDDAICWCEKEGSCQTTIKIAEQLNTLATELRRIKEEFKMRNYA